MNAIKLYGSFASPFVRRVRILLNDREYEFIPTNVLSSEGREFVRKYNPTGRVPFIIDGEEVVWDSLLILEYLTGEQVPLNEKKRLTLLNDLTDAGLQLFLLRRFGTDVNDEGEYSKNNLERIELIFDYFENNVTSLERNSGDWLMCTLDWFSYREVYMWENRFPKLKKFYDEHITADVFEKTNPRND